MQAVLDRYEARRLECVRKLKIGLGIVGGLMAIGIAATLSAQGPVLFPLIAGVVIGGIVYYALTHGFKKSFKAEVVSAVVEAYLEGLRYYPERKISRSQFEYSKLYTKGIDRYKGEDYISGKLGETDFEFSEVHAQYKTTSTDSKGRRSTSWHTIFRGIFFIADFHKNFHTRTVVLPDTAEKLFGFLGQKLQSMNLFRGQLIKLENPDFEREFCVYGDDQIEARYILSPSLMERILSYKRKFGSDMRLAFVDSKVYVALSSNKNRFEPKMFQPINDGKLLNEYRADLDLIIGIVEDLNLNTRVWSKV